MVASSNRSNSSSYASDVNTVSSNVMWGPINCPMVRLNKILCGTHIDGFWFTWDHKQIVKQETLDKGHCF